MLLGLPMVGGSVLHQTRNNMNKCIAFVDDDRQVCRYFREYAIYRGYECHCYHEAENALKAIVRNREGVWAICVDLTLPGSLLQGPELITELRVRGVTAPIIVVTEDVSPTTQLALTNENIDGYIRKRDMTRPLLFKLIETSWKKRGYEGLTVERGALRYDSITHVVSYRGKAAKSPLEPSVGRALEKFLATPREMVAYERIAWDVEGVSSTSAKAQKIVSALRTVLESVGLKDAIRTVRDLGYVLERFD